MKNAIELKNVIKKYGDNFQLGELQLEIPSGVIVGLIGENGAGKTTLIKSILNMIHIDKGDIHIFNKDYQAYESDIKEDIGVVLDNMFLPEILFVKDVDMIMKDVYKAWDRDMFFHYLKQFDISPNKQIKTLSKGMRKKLEIAVSLSHHAKLLILDEPTSGLDPVVREEVLEVFQKFVSDEEHTILLSTHITSDLEHIADYILFMDKGNIILNDMKDDILDNYGILKCDLDVFSSIDKKDILAFRKNKYHYDILVENKNKIKKKYKEFIIDKVTLEELMVLMIKGERIC